ncbi:MAG: 23S rRNA (adenine(2503)-C(2))-methyltransferase RlmN [Deltaproteobacteria bacterium]|nr:23S rRNA (adenine(2503)-C(2))-methyltransferase RlmN [Deltaproteobacteria bacterium]
MDRRDIFELSLAEIESWCAERSLPRYRAQQVTSWLYQRGLRDFQEMTNVPRPLRDALVTSFTIGSLELAMLSRSSDGTQKLLFRLRDGATIESVLIPDGARLTLCVSTQVGCAMGCTFCATATLGFRRHLTRGEIVEQLLQARPPTAPKARESSVDDGDLPARITNLVFMGMGEPLHNYAGTVGAIETLTSSWGVAFSHRRITVSTVGLVPEMQRLLADTQAQLAVSLTSVDETTRRELMPITKKYSVAELLAACRALPLPRRKRITFEYVLIAAVNDRVDDARALARALAGIRCKVNLIPFNPFPGSSLRRSDDVSVARFQDVVRRAGVHATVRESRGPDIAAACGQLVAAEERRARDVASASDSGSTGGAADLATAMSS